jgi:UDP-2-acetamido-2,6-beta-L-arabino-hexul-4-ose reductase
MIIGRGNIASVIEDRDNVTFFAAGVSDSGCTDKTQFSREVDLLFRQDRKTHLVYFSSLSIYHTKNAYNTHKKYMEDLVREYFNSSTIFRIEVIAWGKNPTTIHNVFRRKLEAGEPVTIQDTYRYVLQKEEFQRWLKLIPVGEKHEMNVLGTRYHISEIYQMVREGRL